MLNNKKKKPTIIYYLSVTALCFSALTRAEEQNEALNLSVEDLLNTEVTSVSKKAQSLNDAPAAAFVITNEDIKRSGATSIPDALRLAPGLNVARIDSNKWAVSARGFNGRFANKLLVLVDGRSAYTRTFAGVYWENQDVMMEDIDRIEVIRGPGAALWGANAVNGVINIITKHSSQTQGALLNAGGGTQERDFGSFRYGAKLGEDTTARAYIKGFNRDENTRLSGGKAGDAWDKVQGGFRMDSQLNFKDALTFQGDLYQTHVNEFGAYPQLTSPFQVTGTESNNAYGGNLLSRLQHTFSPTSNYSLQFYYDTYTRNEVSNFENRDTLDLDFQHRFALLNRHDIVWGLNYRFGHDRIKGRNSPSGLMLTTVNPVSVNDQVYSSFIQDELTLIDNKLWLTMGSKFEHNDYSGFEGQPSARIMWAPYNQHRLWAGVSRAVRTPNRSDQNISSLIHVIPPQDPLSPPVALVATPNPNLHSEQVIAYEAGYRTTFSKSVSLDVTGFYNDYHDLRNETRGTPFFSGTSLIMPINYSNTRQGKTYGIEIATVWQMLDWWRWDTNYSWLHTQFSDANNMPAISPQHQVSLRGALSLRHDIDLDFWFRYTDSAFAIGTASDMTIKGYVTLDLRAAWRVCQNIELSLTGQNLLAEKHLEYVQEFKTLPTAINRGMYGKISWHF
jgi:iron complex outermembrane receptor protein